MAKKGQKKKITSTQSKFKSSILSRLEARKFHFSFGIFIAVISVYLHQSFKISRFDSIDTNGLNKYWLQGNETELEFKSVEKVLNEMSMKKIEMTFRKNEDIHMNWELSWTHGQQADLSINFDKLKPYQKLNHFPGNDVLTTKRILAAKIKSKYVPKAFDTVRDLEIFANLNPSRKFIFKNEAGTSIKSIAEMDLEKPDRKFVQEYIENPLLLSGHKFDFGVFVVITSIDPLRLYYYPENILLRFCAEPYNPLNTSDTSRFSSSRSGVQSEDFPEINNRLKSDKTAKRALESYFKDKGIDFTTIWSNVEECIRNVVIDTEKYFVKEVNVQIKKQKWKKRQNFKFCFLNFKKFPRE